MFDIHKKKLYKYKNISDDINIQKQAYFFDLEVKSIVFPYLEKLEDSFKNYLIQEIGDRFLDEDIFNEKFLETRKQFNQEKLEELQKRYKNIKAEIFFLNLTFGEVVRYFRDLKKDIKEKIIGKYGFRKVYIFENWIFSMRYFRNLVCHGENIFNRNFEQKIKGKVIAKLLNQRENDIFLSYLVVLEVFNKISGGKNLIYGKILDKKNNSPVLGHISNIEIEGWGVLIKKVYSDFIKNQVFFEENDEKIENKQVFQENELNKLKEIIKKEKQAGKTIVWTNGCFDIMHPGHMRTFEVCKRISENGKGMSENIVVVGLNGKDSSYWKTKPGRPINDEEFRAKMLASLKNVDYVYIFNDETPVRPVGELKPDYVLKGGDYYIKEISKEFLKGLKKKKKEKLEEFNKIVEKELVKKKGKIIDITDIYEYFIKNDLIDIVKNVKGFMLEGLINVKNGGKVVLVPIVEGCSTTNIVEKIKNL